MPKKKRKQKELERSSINDFTDGGEGRKSMRNSLADPNYRGEDY